MPLSRLYRNVRREVSNIGSALEKPFRTGATQAQRQQRDQLDFQREEIERQRQLEEERKARIDEGTALINSRFDELGGGTQRVYDPPGSGLGSHLSRAFRGADGDFRNMGGVRKGRRGFTEVDRPAIWDQHSQSYLDWANPQVDQKHTDARNQMIFRLSDMGRAGGGSTSIDRFGRLGDDYTQARADTADRALDIGNQTRRDVNTQRANMINLLQQTGDPSQITPQLGQVIDTLRSTPSFNPLGPMFQNATAGLGSYLDGARFGQMQSNVNQTPIYSSPSSGSGRVVR